MPKKGPKPGSPEFGMRAHERRANIQAGNVFPKKKAAGKPDLIPTVAKPTIEVLKERKKKVEKFMKY